MDLLKGFRRGAFYTLNGFARFLTLEELKNFVGFGSAWLLIK